MMLRLLVPAAAVVAALACPSLARAQTELKNDGFQSGQSAGFQGGFHDGEIGAARFVGPGARQLLAVRLLFGGATSTRTVTLHVWDDSGGATAPGGELFNGDFQLTGANDQLHEIDLSGMNVLVPVTFRVGIEMQGATGVDLGYPSIARDADGSIAADKNYLYADIGTGTFNWFRSQQLGLTGDWIIRAVVSDGGGSPDAGVDAAMGGPDASMGGPDASTGPDASMGGSCNGNGDCAIGSYCDTSVHACTFDCRMDQDCGGGGMSCNSLGQCVAAAGDEGGGCCSTGGDGALGALGLAGAVGLLVTRRRRRAA